MKPFIFVLILQSMANFCFGIEWKVGNGKKMNNVVAWNHHIDNRPVHFCQVIDEPKDKIFTGTMKEGDTVCQYVDTFTKKVKTSHKYEVLTLSADEEMGWQWAYPGSVPDYAVPCQDARTAQSCYLGVSLYSDGICAENPGKIMNGRMIHFGMNREPYRCPFYMYLTIKKQQALTKSDNDKYQIIKEDIIKLEHDLE